MNTTFPRSPVGFKWRFAISSRKGTTTVHPRDAVSSQRNLVARMLFDVLMHTEPMYDVAAQKPRSSEDCSSMSFLKSADVRICVTIAIPPNADLQRSC